MHKYDTNVTFTWPKYFCRYQTKQVKSYAFKTLESNYSNYSSCAAQASEMYDSLSANNGEDSPI